MLTTTRPGAHTDLLIPMRLPKLFGSAAQAAALVRTFRSYRRPGAAALLGTDDHIVAAREAVFALVAGLARADAGQILVPLDKSLDRLTRSWLIDAGRECQIPVRFEG